MAEGDEFRSETKGFIKKLKTEETAPLREQVKVQNQKFKEKRIPYKTVSNSYHNFLIGSLILALIVGIGFFCFIGYGLYSGAEEGWFKSTIENVCPTMTCPEEDCICDIDIPKNDCVCNFPEIPECICDVTCDGGET